MKYTWIFINSVNLVILVGFGSLGYLLFVPSKDIKDVVYAVLITEGTISVVVMQPLLTYYFRNEIEDTFTLNEEVFFKNIQTESVENEKLKRRPIGYVMILKYVISYLYYWFRPLQSIYSDDADFFNNLEYYITPHIWHGRVQTQSQYYMLISFQVISMSLVLPMVINFSTNIIFIGYEYCIAFTKLRSFLKDNVERYQQNIEQEYDNSIHSEIQLRSKWLGIEVIEYNREQLMNKVVTTIRAHQFLLRYVWQYAIIILLGI